MNGRPLTLWLSATLLLPGLAWAGPPHVTASRVVEPVPSTAVYAVQPGLSPAARRALEQGLTSAGLKVVEPGQPHTHLVVVRAVSQTLCTASCSALVQHDDAPLDDYYRHGAVVAAQATDKVTPTLQGPVSWYVVLQKDGLSNRRDDFLPGLLRYGAKAYGREIAAEHAARLTPPVPRSPDLYVSPGV